MSALERHVAFFDPEHTGEVTIGQTWRGLLRLGIPVWHRLWLTPIINGFLGYLTQGKVSFRIAVARIAKGKHPFDSGTFGDDGAVDEAAYDLLVEAGREGSLTAREMRALILARGNRRAAMGKVAGALGSWFSGREVQLFFCLAADATKVENGAPVPSVTPRTLRRLYDGTLFPLLARRRRISLGRPTG
ncbi:MAG: hypothetical protein JWP97_3523 [Labilithrix sp.]|nr:hypothetical protein [Labilithrix sp.]